MKYTAIHRFADVGPRKIRLFADLVRGKNVDEAIQLLLVQLDNAEVRHSQSARA